MERVLFTAFAEPVAVPDRHVWVALQTEFFGRADDLIDHDAPSLSVTLLVLARLSAGYGMDHQP